MRCEEWSEPARAETRRVQRPSLTLVGCTCRGRDKSRCRRRIDRWGDWVVESKAQIVTIVGGKCMITSQRKNKNLTRSGCRRIFLWRHHEQENGSFKVRSFTSCPLFPKHNQEQQQQNDTTITAAHIIEVQRRGIPHLGPSMLEPGGQIQPCVCDGQVQTKLRVVESQEHRSPELVRPTRRLPTVTQLG